jgi:hypothetical protein
MAAPDTKYAVYPGTVTTYAGDELTFTASELAVLYGVDDEAYLTVSSAAEEAALLSDAETYLQYIHLKPRPDNVYYDAKDGDHTQDDRLLGEDFDGKRKYTQETRQPFDDLKEKDA